jgi:hypothetical protein
MSVLHRGDEQIGTFFGTERGHQQGQEPVGIDSKSLAHFCRRPHHDRDLDSVGDNPNSTPPVPEPLQARQLRLAYRNHGIYPRSKRATQEIPISRPWRARPDVEVRRAHVQGVRARRDRISHDVGIDALAHDQVGFVVGMPERTSPAA